MINIFKSTKIFVACPSQVATGGPLALHQLAYKLQSKGYNSVIYYYDNWVGENPTHVNYQHYETSYVTEIEDRDQNILIVPESDTFLLYNFSKIKRVIWWLSIDNYYPSAKGLKYTFFYYLGLRKQFEFKDSNKFYHLAQSKYALEFLKSQNIIDNKRIGVLSDYLLKIFFKENEISKKENIVLYNPMKGKKFTKKIISENLDLNWIPIENLTPIEVKNLLNTSKIYIDFGEHPGRDRFPREAVISGCCLLTGKRGSANYYEDIPINDEYKFNESKKDIPLISLKIREILKNYSKEVNNFRNYREFIQNNETIFENEIDEVFRNDEL